MKQEKKEELFKEFLSSGNIMVVDKSSASRRRLTKTLVDLGAKRAQIDSIAHFSEAVETIKSKKPKLILSDYELNGGSGFDLFKEYRENYPDEKKSVLILVTSNISQSAVAKAAEEDVDSFIIKPYTAQSLEKSLTNAVITKLYPSEYAQAIEKGKEALFAGNYPEALEIFEGAKALSKKPSLAMFYHGQTQYMMKQMEEAEEDYKEGLAVNSIHFKCQVGLYNLFMEDKKYFEAYSVVKNIAKYFPANPERLKEVVRLCMITENYPDMDLYYELFTQLDERGEDVINYVCAGLYILGKFYLMEGKTDEALTTFEKVGVSCSGIAKFITAMIKILVKYDFYDDAQKLVSRYSSGGDSQSAYKIGKYIAYSNSPNMTEMISQGLELWNQGNKDPEAVAVLIKCLEKDGADKKAQDYKEEAEHLWPDVFAKIEQKVA